MNSAQLMKAAKTLYGNRGWQTKMAAALEINTSTIRRWIYADQVPGPAAAALRCFLSKEQNRKK